MNLSEFGIVEPIEIIGTYDILFFEKDAPIVFLIDENHDNLNNCIAKNIVNAFELIQNVNIAIVGVESLAGGKSWDFENRIYSESYPNKKFDDLFVKRYKSDCTKFADEIKKLNPSIICGVESFGMTHVIEEDFLPGGLFEGKEITDHPLNKERSKHFIKTLFEKRNELGLDGNLILNCGSNHNSDIEEWVNNNEIHSITGFKASYIRLNAIDI